MRYLLIPAALLVTTAAHAVPYALPSGPDIAQAKLSGPLPSHAVACDSRTGVPCDVTPGEYQLQTFDQSWHVTKSRVTIEGDTGGTPSSAIAISTARAECESTEVVTIDEMSSITCRAECPVGTRVIATQCDALDALESGGNVLTVIVDGRCVWQEPSSQFYFAYATCLTD